MPRDDEEVACSTLRWSALNPNGKRGLHYLPIEPVDFTDNLYGYGTVKGRSPSVGKMPVGAVTVEGWARNM